MAVLWFGPFYVVVMWAVVSSFMGSTWSDRNSYSNYLDNADITTGQGLKNQEQLRQGSTRKEEPCNHDGRYIYDRMSKESQSRNSDPGVLLTNFWNSQVPEDFFYRRDGETDSNLNQESWFNPDFKISSDSLTKQKMQQDNDDDEADVNGLVRLGRGSLKRVAEKRQGHSLSIVNPLDVLRHRLMLDLAERRMKENQNQIKANDAILKIIGKRKKRTLAKGSETKEGRIAMRKRQAVDYFDWPQNSATSNIEA